MTYIAKRLQFFLRAEAGQASVESLLVVAVVATVLIAGFIAAVTLLMPAVLGAICASVDTVPEAVGSCIGS